MCVCTFPNPSYRRQLLVYQILGLAPEESHSGNLGFLYMCVWDNQFMQSRARGNIDMAALYWLFLIYAGPLQPVDVCVSTSACVTIMLYSILR